VWITIPWLLGLGWSLAGYYTYTRAAHTEAATHGFVISRTEMHGHYYHYRYSVDGRGYLGADNSERWFNPGNQLLIYYDRINPIRSALTEFRRIAQNRFAPVPLLVLGITGTWIGGYLYRRRKERQGP
jgi:hypothetical protein